MGTRADFYVKKIEDEPFVWNAPIEWIGSIGWDGYPDGIDPEVLKAKTYTEFSNALNIFFNTRDDVTYPEDGWPWPWETSELTDFSYLFDCNTNKVLVYHEDNNWIDVARFEDPDFYPDDAEDLVVEANYTLPIFDNSNPRMDNGSGLIVI